MSIRAMTWVFDLQKPTLGTRLVLLSLADNAGAKADHDDAEVAWPSIRLLARKSVLSERQVKRALKALAEDGYITHVGTRDSGVRMWRLEVGLREGGDNMSPRDTDVTGGVTPMSPESEVEPQVEDSLRSSSTSSAEKIEKLRATNGVVALCDRLAELMRERDPKIKVDPVSLRWLDAAEKLMRIEERHFEEAMKVLEFSQRDPFWQTVILSMPTFRAKYSALRAKWINTLQRNGSAPQKPQATVAELMEAQERFHADQRERLARRGITPDSSSRERA